jgi:hypothetical protein
MSVNPALRCLYRIHGWVRVRVRVAVRAVAGGCWLIEREEHRT